jgi:hypothetical protein
MHARETTVKAMLGGQKQYVVPLFQRKYRWTRDHWNTLWVDVLDNYQTKAAHDHFLGSAVTLPRDGTPDGITPFSLIDGQQRLTTLSLLLAAIRDLARPDDAELAERVDGLYLRNRYVSGFDRFKVLPTQADREAFAAVIDSEAPVSGSAVSDAYKFFVTAIRKGDDDGHPIRIADLESVVLNKLSLVSITLDKDDNPYRIFESLNAKGMRLTQSDLLRNYVFMRLPLVQHEEVYNVLWRPMEDRLGSRIEEFIRDHLVKDGEFVRKEDVYQAWKDRLDDLSSGELRSEIESLGRFSTFYKKLIAPVHEPDEGVRELLVRLNRWGGTTIYPFLLNMYADRDSGRVSNVGLRRVLQFVESFLVRRLFANVPTNALNRIFIRLYKQLPAQDDIVDATHRALSQSGLRWPSDNELRDGVMNYPLYIDSRPDQRKMILEVLEESYAHQEPVDMARLTIEHVMPQSLTNEWQRELGDSARDIHKKYLHTLGNLTLTGYNSPLSNLPFERKQQILERSHLELNREVAQSPAWNEGAILERAQRLFERAVQIWPEPIRSVTQS